MRILIARDEAFNFIYKSNVDALMDNHEVSFFSPLRDSSLPACDLLYLPGGYPELFLENLSKNFKMMEDIRRYAQNGGRIFAECGGFMYLCQEIDSKKMCGVLPLNVTMESARLHLGYRQMQLDDLLIKGHEFHYSSVMEQTDPDMIQVLRLQRNAMEQEVDTPLYHYRNVLAGYTHWYWAEIGFDVLWEKLSQKFSDSESSIL